MLLNWRVGANLCQDGFSLRGLEDGRSCLLWTKGYFFDSGGHMWLDDEIIDWLTARLVANRLADLVPGMNGCFSVLVVWPEARVAEVGIDRFGTIPLYYNVGNRSLIVSDDYWKVASRMSSADYDADAILSMILLGYVAGYRTLLKGITEFPQAAIHHFSLLQDVPELTSQRYWMCSRNVVLKRTRAAWRDDFAETLCLVFERHAQAILARDWDVQIPLSGGKDSRLLVGMFTRSRVQVKAFSYGPTGNIESQCAAQVANVLGIPLRLVPIDDPTFLMPSFIQLMTRRVGMKARFTTGLGGQLAHGISSAQNVFVPGHSGDLVAGSWLDHSALRARSRSQAVQHLINRHMSLTFDEMIAALIPRTWCAGSKAKLISSNWQFNPNDSLGSVDRWNYENRQRRLILSEMRTYEQFGHWLLPFYDHEFFDFFTNVPVDLCYKQRLYIDTLVHNIFVNRLAPLAQIPTAAGEIIKLPALSWRDWAYIKVLPPIINDWILKRATDRKLCEQLESVGKYSSKPSGPDPLDYWWYECSSFREAVSDTFQGWDGMQGVVDVPALMNVLQKPLPRFFILFGIPALLTLYYFQQIVESEIQPLCTQLAMEERNALE